MPARPPPKPLRWYRARARGRLILNEAPSPVMTSTAVRYVNVSYDAARGEAKLEVNESAFEGAKPESSKDGQVGVIDLQVERRGEGGGGAGGGAPRAAPAAEAMPEADQAAAAVKMQSAQRGMAARRMSKELAASAVVKRRRSTRRREGRGGAARPHAAQLARSPTSPARRRRVRLRQGGDAVLPAADASLAAGDIIVSVKGEAVVAHDRARDLVRASGTTVWLSVRKHAVDLDAIGGAFSTGVAWPQLDESSRALWTSLGWDAVVGAGAVAADGGPRVEAARRRRARRRGARVLRGDVERHEEVELAFKAEAEEKKRKEIAPRAPTAGPVKEGRSWTCSSAAASRAAPRAARTSARDGRHIRWRSPVWKAPGWRGGKGVREGALMRSMRASNSVKRISFH